MFRHHRYLDIPWEMHEDQKEAGRHHLMLMVILIFLAMFLIGVGVISGVG